MQTTPERSVFSHRLKSPTTVLAFYCILKIIHPREYIEELNLKRMEGRFQSNWSLGEIITKYFTRLFEWINQKIILITTEKA